MCRRWDDSPSPPVWPVTLAPGESGPRLDSAAHTLRPGLFFLGRQNALGEVRLKLLEIRGGITAKASTQGPLLAAGLSCLPECLPGTDVLGSEFGRGVGMPPGGRGSNHAERAAQDHTRRSCFAPCRTPLMVAIRSEKLF